MDQQEELENIIRDLEEENVFLMEEYTRLQNQLNMNQTTSVNTSNNAQTVYSNSSKVKASNYQQQIYDLTQSQNTIGNSGSRGLSSSPTLANQTIQNTLLPQSSYIGSYQFLTSNGSLNKNLTSGGSMANLQINNKQTKLSKR